MFFLENPWVCDERLEWLRQWLRENPDIVIDKQPGCTAVCKAPTALDNVPLRSENPLTTPEPLPTEFEGLVAGAMSHLHWIILGKQWNEDHPNEGTYHKALI